MGRKLVSWFWMIVVMINAVSISAVELTPDAVIENDVSSGYASVKDGEIVFGKEVTAYSPDSMNRILRAYGVTLMPEAINAKETPAGYAAMNEEGDIVFGKDVTAYSPKTFNTLLNAYGLILTIDSEDVTSLPSDYVRVSNGRLVFGDQATAYSPESLDKILGSYNIASDIDDSDGDGVTNNKDQCPNTQAGITVDSQGCPLDSDGDGVADNADKCLNTPAGIAVDSNGCPLDNDGDGIADYLDNCLNTPKGQVVDDKGCPSTTTTRAVEASLEPESPPMSDSDKDGVPDVDDQCPDTPTGVSINPAGCWVASGVNFKSGSWDIESQYYPALDNIADTLNKNANMRVEIQGHTDNIGSARYNQELSEKRAQAVMSYIVKKGIDKSRLSAKGYGFSRPSATNATPEGRDINRRVQIDPVK